MRKTYLGAILLGGILAGAALAVSDPTPPSGGDEARWRPWEEREPVTSDVMTQGASAPELGE